ncbi:MAG TPA: Zn-dependent hydrolase, partial [Terriglobales bacterium]|nr:Zn-dependent hydrolase [Terriglobales bacterium]
LKSQTMVIRGVVVALLFVCLLVSGQAKPQSNQAKNTRSARLSVVPDLEQRLSKFREVDMPFHPDGLSAREKQMVLKLVDACRYLDDIYWRQVDPEALDLYESLEGSSNPEDVALRRFLWINGSHFDLLHGNQPFVNLPSSLGGGFYPSGITRQQIEEYVKLHPEKRGEIYSNITIVRWKGKDLQGIPYHVAFRSLLEPAAKALREAADLSPDEAFAKFLRMRADALLNDQYFDSDIAWLELKRPKVDVIFAPYETYNDGLLGVKATYGGAVMIRNEEQSRRMETFQKYVADIQDALPIDERDRPSKHGLETPMEVVDSPFRTADLGHGYQAVADNLPNDPRVHELKGSKKIFFKNFMDARVNYVILPLARYMMPEEQVAIVSGEGYLFGTIMHEICHGLGPAFAHNNSGQKVDIREAIGPIYGGLEEAKADVVGMFALKWLVDHGVLPKEKLRGYYASYLAGNFRTLRFGAAEAHGQAEMMEFNYYLEHGAVRRLPSGKYEVDYEKMPVQIENLGKELLEMEATGDRARAEAWFKKYDVIAPEVQQALDKAESVPVDVDPLFSFPREVQ